MCSIEDVDVVLLDVTRSDEKHVGICVAQLRDPEHVNEQFLRIKPELGRDKK